MEREIGRLYPMNNKIGYLCFTDRTHPLADKCGRVYYHRHVASVKVGRWLESGEVVHHVDGDICNNDPDNLEIMRKDAHIKGHWHGDGTLDSFECNTFDPSAEELRVLAKEKTPAQIAKEYGVHPETVRKRFKKHNVEWMRIGSKEYRRKRWEEKMKKKYPETYHKFI